MVDPIDLHRAWDPSRRVFAGTRGPVRLSTRETRILDALFRAGGSPVPRDELDGGPGRVADFAIRRLRNKIEDDPGAPRIVLTVHGLGYRIGLPAAPPSAAPPRELLSLGDRELDLDLGIVHRLGEEITLTTLQHAVLRTLVQAGGRTVSRDELLRRCWGPSRDARAVDTVVHQLRTVLEPSAAAPTHLLTVRGAGYRLQLATPKTNLPPAAPLAVGRSEELAATLAALHDTGSILLVGPPGVGKSHLAERACRNLADTLPGGAWWVDGAPHRTPSGLTRAVAAVLGIAEGARDLRAVGFAVGRRPRTALILDNLEQIDGVEAVVRTLVGAGARVVVTSSRMLDLPGRTLALGGLPVADARELYLRTAPLDTDTDGLDALLASLDGLPLAIELAARRATTHPARTLVDRPDRLDLLQSRSDSESRHGSVRAALDWTWSLCNAEERRALLACRVFRSPFDLEAAAAVSGASPEILGRLVDRSFLTAVRVGSVAIFRFHGLIASWLSTRGEPGPETVERWAAWFAARARVLFDDPSVAEAEARAEFHQTKPDLVAAALHLVRTFPEKAAHIALLLNNGESMSEDLGRELTEPLLAAPPFPSQPLLWEGHVWRMCHRGDLAAAEDTMKDAFARGLDPACWPARRAVMHLASMRGDLAAADPGPEPPVGSFRDRIHWMQARASHLVRVGATDDGVALLQRAILLARRHGSPGLATHFGDLLAHALGLSGADPDRVAAVFEASTLAYEGEGRWMSAARVAREAADVRAHQGRRAQARVLAERSLAIAVGIGDVLAELRARTSLVTIDLDGDPAALLFTLGDLASSLRAIGDGTGSARAGLYLAICHARLGDVEAALARIDATDATHQPLAALTLDAVAALLDADRPVPEPPPVRHWARSVALFVAHRRGRGPLTDRYAITDVATSPPVRAVSQIAVTPP